MNHAAEICKAMLADSKLSAVCGRVSELMDLGTIEELPRRRCGVTGSNAHPVQLARKQGALF